MKKSEALNTFALGLVMDINPLVAPNDGVCNALNATLITMNGNENVLQNDMGNGRVETAFLPEGYVPLGTTELGGIIYIVSYNPLNKKCLIGSFPSPERNISSDEVSDLNQAIKNEDFRYNEKTGALVYYLKKELNKGLTFNPGDKFIIYGDTIGANFNNLYNEASYTPDKMSIAKNYTLKLDIGTITDTGKLVKFENLKQYNISDKGKYHIFLYSGKDTLNPPDLDEYRSLVSLPYNIFSSKISGSLVLIAELVQFNDFDVLIKHVFTTILDYNGKNHKMYAPKGIFTFSGDYPFIPNGVMCEISLFGKNGHIDTDTFYYIIPDDKISSLLSKDNTLYEVELEEILRGSVLEDIQTSAKYGYFDTKERNAKYVIKYKFTPCMNWGPVSYLAVTGLIDLDKLGTGYIEISLWKYYNESNKCNLTWGLEIYEEEGYFVNKVEMDFTRFTKFIESDSKELSSENYSIETVTYKVNNKASYFGIFNDILPINEDYYRLTGKLKPNCLYLVKIKVTYASPDNSSKDREFYRWLYTNTIFNQHYIDTADFQTLSPNFTPGFKFNYTYNPEYRETKSKTYGIIRLTIEELSDTEKDKVKNSKSSLSAILTMRDFSVQGNLTVGLIQDYNTFYLKAGWGHFDINPDSNGFKCSSSSVIKFSDREDSNLDEYLKSEGLVVDSGELSKYEIPTTSGLDISESLLKIPTNVVLKSSITPIEFDNNIYTFLLNYSVLLTVKAYCSKIISTLTYKGKFIPLAYNRETFLKYNLEWNTSIKKWLPFTVGLFGFQERGGDNGEVWIGGWNSGGGDSEKIKVEGANNVNLHWTTDPDIPPAQSTSGWSGTAMFFVHKWGATNSDCLKNIANGGYPLNPGAEMIYSYPTEKHSDKNRILLSFKSNNGDNFFYPINYSMVGSGNNDISKMIAMETFSELFNDFAKFLNNLYRYDSEEVSQQCVIPLSIYWMDECKYSLSISFNIKSNPNLNNNNIYLMLDEGKIKLKSMIDNFINIGYLENKDYPTLWDNISSTVLSINDKFTFNIVNSDNNSGIEMRNYMLDRMGVSLGTAIMDYDGTSILTTTSASSDNRSLYTRYDTDGKPNVIKAANFDPKNITYYEKSVGNSYEIIPSVEKNRLDMCGINLNRYFIINEDNMLVLRDPKSSEFSFKRDGEYDTGIADGYLKAWPLYKYKSY